MVDQAKRLLGRANAKQTVGMAAMFISGSYLLSQLLGLLRTRLLVAHFGTGYELSAYYAAFRLPDLLFAMLISGAFAVAFIPVLTEYLDRDQRELAWRVTASLLNLLVLATIVGGVLIVVFAEPLTTLLTPGFNAETHNLTVNLTRIMAITPVFFAISTVLGSVQQAFNRFLIFSLSGVFYNVGIIIGIMAFASRYGVYGPAWGVVLGVVLQAILQWLGLYGLGFKYRLIFAWRTAGVLRVLKLMVPRGIAQGLDQINYSVETVIGSMVSQGAIAQFSVASSLRNVPLILIGSSITTAVFPRLAARAASGERQHLTEIYVQTARLILFLAIPSALFAFVARGYIVRLLCGSGDPFIANTLGWFAGTIVFSSLFMLVSRMFYAMQNTKTPLYVSLGTIPINIALSIYLSRLYGVVGLAMSASIVAVVQTLVLSFILRRRYGSFGERSILRGGVRMTVSGAIMAVSVYLFISRIMPLYAVDRGFITLSPKFLLILAIGAATYLLPCYLLRVNEATVFAGRVRDITVRSFNLT